MNFTIFEVEKNKKIDALSRITSRGPVTFLPWVWY